ncbi:hypothetical protein [Nafulsella turpanensis]|uniref:hypothetical protein n=1 Tax=Nafulsella turpanensis TaxID=1265690 RepID=UPI000375381C|nr:hypothetical protein [Nafulsella turpanensis]
MKLKALLLFGAVYLSCWSSLLQAQTFQRLYAFHIEPPVTVAADTYGRIYVATREGEISSYTPTGELLYTYSPQSAAYYTALDAKAGLQIGSFDENSQQLLFLDRFLNLLSTERLPPDLFGYATALSWSAGNTLWVADAGSLQLKKWAPGRRELLTTVNLSQFGQESTFNIEALKEYQHKLYLFTQNRLYVFDCLGTFEKMLPLPEWIHYTFADDQLLLLTADSLLRFPLYGGKPDSFALPEGGPYTHLLYSEEIYFFFNEEIATAYRQLP